MSLLGWAIGFLAFSGYLFLQQFMTAVVAALIVGIVLFVLAVVPWEKLKK